MSGKFSNDAGTHQSMYALRDRDLRLALHFRELRPAVSGETGKASVVDGGFFAALLTPGSQCDRQHDESSRKCHSVLKKGLHLLVSCTSYLKPEREACILRMRQVTTIAGLAVVAWGLISGGNLLAATVPQGFTETIISGPWTNAVGVAFEDNGRMYVWEGTGQVWFKDPGDGNYTLLLDIHDEVGKWGDHGMLGFALDPDFRVNGYIYVLYVVDRYYLFHSGDPDYDPNANEYNAATIGRLTRYTCRSADGFRSVDPASRQILIGETRQTGIPICSTTHGVGTLVFGADDTLLLSCGYGASYQVADIGCAQTSHFPPDGNPGVLYLGHVGWSTWEALDVVASPRQNFGWPTYEGLSINPGYNGNNYNVDIPNQDAPNPLYPAAGCSQYFSFRQLLHEDTLDPAGQPPFANPCDTSQRIPSSIPQFLHVRPVLDWNHGAAVTRTPIYGPSGDAQIANVGDPGSPVSGTPFAGNCAI